MFNNLFEAYGLVPEAHNIQNFGNGLINHTWKITYKEQQFILQQINALVFKNPEHIAHNIDALSAYLHVASPQYLFVTPIDTLDGRSLICTEDGDYYRLFPFVSGSHTVDTVKHPDQAYQAALQFGRFTRLLTGFDTGILKQTLPDFHNLPLRYDQFNAALLVADTDRLVAAALAIDDIKQHSDIVKIYSDIKESGFLKVRVIHHDTKISNVLFDDNEQGICVIDLDTVMPGYYISDIGDMLRTYLSPVSEEEKDLSKIEIRDDFFRSIYTGYMSEMGNILTETEKGYFIFAGKFMIYMQAMRFLTDYLNGDVYYQAKYEGHNLLRAQNQIAFLNKFIAREPFLEQIIADQDALVNNTGI